jgi:hypothetical protein
MMGGHAVSFVDRERVMWAAESGRRWLCSGKCIDKERKKRRGRKMSGIVIELWEDHLQKGPTARCRGRRSGVKQLGDWC